MKQFMILCLFGLALAKPQGYNYFLPNTANSFNENIHSTIGTQHVQHTNQINQVAQNTKVQPLITKYFFIHAAPEETEEEIQKELNVGQPEINYKIIFIKAPSYGSRAAKLALKQSQVEDKTIIYVLSQKKDIEDIQTNIEMVPQHVNKPEVFFIKYKTPEEALHAQQQIQAQYDALGGKTQVSDEGIAPVSSVIGVLQNQQNGAAITTGSSSSQLSSTSDPSTFIAGAPSHLLSASEQSIFTSGTPLNSLSNSGSSTLTSGTESLFNNLGQSVLTSGTSSHFSGTSRQSTYLPPNK